MRKRIRIVIPVLAVLALVISAFALAVPAAAVPPPCEEIPEGADTNFIAIGITVPPGTYYVGDTIYYTVNVLVPAASGGFAPAQQTSIDVYLVLPGGVKGVDDVYLGTIATLDPGASYAFAPYAYVIAAAHMVEMEGLQVVTAEAWCAGTAMLCPRVGSDAAVEIATEVVEEDLLVTKTVETSYIRTHEWDIEKWVETEDGHTIGAEEYPKIWLYEDGNGDEWATWYVCVDYLGYVDSGFNVSGTVTIENTGTAAAVITGVEDYLGGTLIDVEFGVTFPYTLGVGDTLVGDYDEDGEFTGLNEVTVTTERDDYYGSADIIWGDPDQEFYDVVDIEDVSDLFGTQHLGTLYATDYVAGEGVCFYYDLFFAWTDYFTPGPYTYDNTATIVQTGQSAWARLVVNWLYEDLTVEKTVDTYYIRTHEWDIDKWVETEFGHTIGAEEYPKIWLYEDGNGDEWATWYVCVDYLGYVDSDFNVSGTVTITNTGTSAAVITGVEDYLGGTLIDVEFGVTFPYTLGVGDTLVGDYDEDGEFTGLNEVTVTTEVDDYYGSADIIWGDPDQEFYDVVDIEDVSDLFGTQHLGTLYATDYVAGEGVCFYYDLFFAWTDYFTPGPYTYDNTATIVQTGQSAWARLVVNWLYEDLTVEKTVDTYYIRTHEWDIDKWVETEFGHTIGAEEYPKIWLYEDGNGDEWATWYVCVDYLGYVDSDFNVSGTVTITNTGTSAAVITGVEDYLGGTLIDVEFGVTFPYTLGVGDTLVGDYDEDGEFTGLNEVTVTTEVDDYYGSADIIWGDPDQEFYDVVDIEDVSDLFGTQHLGTLYATDYVAGEGVCFYYDLFFAWTDYFTPGPYTYDNTATIVQTGQSAWARLVVNWLYEDLTVEKTVDTYYIRTHEWDIDKWVETEFGHTIGAEEYPKIWLYEDGNGDEWATWYVCVDYLGYVDSDFNVSGTVTITNTGTSAAVITGVEDYLGGTLIDVEFGVTFPYTLGVGDTLVGDYDEDGEFTGLNEVTVTTEVDDYYGSADIIWGDPDQEFYDVVDIEDVSDLFGTQHLGTLYATDYVAGEGVCFYYDLFFAWTDYFTPGPYTYDNTATIVQTGQSAWARLVVNWEQSGTEGCTPGFWKNNAVNWEAVAWAPTGYLPGDSFECVFGVDVTLRGKGKDMIEDPTLLEALGANGGGINALARHAVAALLNISHPDIAYAGGMSVAGLIAAVQDAIAMSEDAIEALHTELAEYNEAGCSIDQHGEPIILDGG